MTETHVERGETVRSMNQLDATAFAAASAVVSAAIMLLLGVAGALGLYEGAVQMMEQWHLFFSPTVVGTVGGMIEGAIVGYVIAWTVAWLYNAFAHR